MWNSTTGIAIWSWSSYFELKTWSQNFKYHNLTRFFFENILGEEGEDDEDGGEGEDGEEEEGEEEEDDE